MSMFILSRLFSHEEFGLFSVFSGFVVMLAIVVAGRYEFAIGLPEKDSDAAALFTICISLSTFIAGLFVVASTFWSVGAAFPKLSVLDPWWGLIGVGAVCIAWYNAAGYMALRSIGFDLVGKSKAVIAAVTAVGQVLAAVFVTRNPGGLIVPFLFGQAAGAIFLAAALWGKGLWQFDVGLLLSVAKRYSRFPKYIGSGSFLDGIAVLIPVAGIAALHSPAEAGIYALAERALRVPVTLIGSSVLQVFYQKMAAIRNDLRASRQLLLQTWQRLAGIALLPCVAVLLFGESIFAVMFGSQWRESGHVAGIMSVSTFLYLVSYSTSNVLVVKERAKLYLGWQLMQLLSMIVALFVAKTVSDPTLLFTVSSIVVAQVSNYLLSMALQSLAAARLSVNG